MVPGSASRPAAAGVVLSDRAARGDYVDRSGPVLRRHLAEWGCEVREVVVIPDEPEALVARLEAWRAAGVALVLTSGGTGIGPRDRTPEALAGWADLAIPGIGEWLRKESERHAGGAGWLSRGGGWRKGGMLVVALPGSPRALEQLLPGLRGIVEHALEMIAGQGHE